MCMCVSECMCSVYVGECMSSVVYVCSKCVCMCVYVSACVVCVHV